MQQDVASEGTRISSLGTRSQLSDPWTSATVSQTVNRSAATDPWTMATNNIESSESEPANEEQDGGGVVGSDCEVFGNKHDEVK